MPPTGLPALVLMMDVEGQEDKVAKIWDLVDKKDEFSAYVAKEAKALMETGS